MRMIDLEMYRWHMWWRMFSKIGAQKSEPIKQSYGSKHNYWLQIKAFTSIMPRQSGKTTMIKILSDELINKDEEVIILDYFVTVNSGKKFNCLYKGIDSFNKHYRGFDYSKYNLFIDNFLHINKSDLHMALDNDWKIVTLVGTLI